RTWRTCAACSTRAESEERLRRRGRRHESRARVPGEVLEVPRERLPDAQAAGIGPDLERDHRRARPTQLAEESHGEDASGRGRADRSGPYAPDRPPGQDGD